MPTSATGTSSKPRRHPAAASRIAGFTLLEVLVVVVIIGIITSMAVVSVNVLGGDHEMDQEARRLVAVLTQAREDALLEGRDVGVRVDAHGYDFMHYDGRNERWEMVSDDPLLRERTLPDGVEASLWLEGRNVRLLPRAAPAERAAAAPEGPGTLQPQVVIMASGDLVPFELRLARAGTREIRAISGSTEARFEILANDAVARR